MNALQTYGTSFLAVAGLVAGLFWLSSRTDSEVRAVVIRVDGPAGAQVTVTIDADGESTATEQPLPCEVTASVRNRVGFSINRLEGADGPFRVELEVDGVSRGQASSSRSVLGRIEFSGTKVTLSSITGI